MSVIDRYFIFKKNNLVTYALLFCEKNMQSDAKPILESFIDTYIESNYYHILKTYYDSLVMSFDKSIIVKEMKGKRLELTEDYQYKKDKLIDFCYEISFIAIAIDLINFDKCETFEDVKSLLKENLYSNKDSNEILEPITEVVFEKVKKEKEFFQKIKSEDFSISYTPYIKGNKRFLVNINFSIEQLSKIYTKPVLEKNFLNRSIEYDKNKAIVNLLNIDLLNKILKNEEINNYFLPLTLSYEYEEEEIKDLVNFFDNPRIKDSIVFLIKYEDYKLNETKFKELNQHNFAILVNLRNVEQTDERLDEISKFDLFRYVIIDEARKEDYSLIDNYVMKGKEIFMNETNLV